MGKSWSFHPKQWRSQYTGKHGSPAERQERGDRKILKTSFQKEQSPQAPKALPRDFSQKDTGKREASSVLRSQTKAPLPEAGKRWALELCDSPPPDPRPHLRQRPSCTHHLLPDHPGLDQQQTQSLAVGFLSAD